MQFAANGRSSRAATWAMHLVSSLAARCHDRRGLEPLGELDRRLRDRGRRVRAEHVVLGDVQRRDAVLSELRDVTL